jgi:hypothetical protein
MHEVDRGDLWVRCHGPFEQGFVYRGHRHWVDHDSFVHSGTKLRVKYRYSADGRVIREAEYTGPCRFLVAAGVYHEIEVLSAEGAWDCEFKKPPPDSPLALVFTHEVFE